MVVLKNDTSKRIFWRLAIVNELLKGDDNKARAAVVKFMDPRGGHRLLRRSIRHLYPIEVHHNQVLPLQNQDSNSSNPSPEGQHNPTNALMFLHRKN